MSSLSTVFTEKQIRALKSDARILVLHGAKRTGKTYILIMKFLMLVAKYRNTKSKFVIGGASHASIQANILDDMGLILGKDIKLDQHKNFELYGNIIMVRHGMTSDAWKTVRGFSCRGVLLNEGTALHDRFIKELISRCSLEGARIYIDTNPENPSHTVKVDYIDKAGQRLDNGKLNIEEINFRLEDNTFLDKEYIQSIKLSTPSGMFYQRDIEGKWVNAQGVIYQDFDMGKHIIDDMPQDEVVIEYLGCIDWGFEHHGALTVIAYTERGNYYLVDAVARQHMYVEQFWLPKALEMIDEYKINVFFGDYARVEYMNLFIDNNIPMYNPNKNVVPGIETVASMFKTNRFFILRKASERFLYEISNYVWADKIGKEEPVKKDDDILDCCRYTIHTHQQKFV